MSCEVKAFIKPKNWAACSLLLQLTLGMGTAEAQVYKWVDASGKTHYGDKTPDSKKSKTEELKIAPPPPQPSNPSPAFSKRDHDFYNPPTSEAKATPKPQAKTPDKCEYSRSIVQAIKEKRAYRSPTGHPGVKDRVYLDEHELELFENDVKQYCK